MATKKVNVEIDVESNADASIKKLNDLRKALEEAAAGSSEFKRLSAEIRDVEDALESATLEANDFRGQLESAPGPVGLLFTAIKQVELATKSWGTALKATGIGLIVAAVAGLVLAFREQEDVMSRLDPLLIQLEKIFNGIFDIVSPLLDTFIELAMDVLPVLSQGLSIFYSTLLGIFNLVKDFGVGVGNVLVGIFTFDTDLIKQGWNTLKDAIPQAVDAGLEAYERFGEGSTRLTSTERRNAEERMKLMEEETKRLEEELRKREELQNAANQVFLANFEDEQRELIEALQRKLEREATLRAAGYTDFTAAEELYRKEVDEIARKYDEIDRQRELTAQNVLRLTLDDEERLRLEALDRKNERERILIEAGYTDLTSVEELYRREIQAINDKYDGIEEEKRRKAADAQLEIERMKAEGIISINEGAVDTVGSLGTLLLQSAERNKGLAIAGVIIEQAAAIAKIIQATNTANALTTAKWALVPGGAAIAARQIALNNIAAGIGIASSVAAGSRAISQMNSVNLQNPSMGGGASGGRGGLYTPTATPERQLPTLSTSSNVDPTTQIAETLQNVTSRPLRAYVVSNDISSQQALDRRTNRAATFS